MDWFDTSDSFTPACYKMYVPQELGAGRLYVKIERISMNPSSLNDERFQLATTIPTIKTPTLADSTCAKADWDGDIAVLYGKHFDNFSGLGYFRISGPGNNGILGWIPLVYYEYDILEVGWEDDSSNRTILFDNSNNPNPPQVPSVSTYVQAGATALATNLLQIGAPSIRFATKPYSTFNFNVAARYVLEGIGAWGGVVGLASDKYNYLLARMTLDSVELVNVRNNREIVLATETISDITDIPTWIMMQHRDGNIQVKIRLSTSGSAIDVEDTYWNTSVINYNWKESDGEMSPSEDIMHVGTYSLRDAPKVRICSYDPAQSSIIGILPGGSDIAEFATSGSGGLLINKKKYSYTGIIDFDDEIRGPYQCRNTGLGFKYTNDGEGFSGNAVEFTMFDYIDNSVNADKFSGRIMASSIGLGYILSETDFKPWITTGGVRIEIHNRSRNYADGVDGDNFGTYHKMWITKGFTGVTALVSDIEEASSHPEGEVAFLDTNSSVKWMGFFASSGYADITVEDMIQTICQLSGAEAEFPGDVLYDVVTLDTDRWLVNP